MLEIISGTNAKIGNNAINSTDGKITLHYVSCKNVKCMRHCQCSFSTHCTMPWMCDLCDAMHFYTCMLYQKKSLNNLKRKLKWRISVSRYHIFVCFPCSFSFWLLLRAVCLCVCVCECVLVEINCVTKWQESKWRCAEIICFCCCSPNKHDINTLLISFQLIPNRHAPDTLQIGHTVFFPQFCSIPTNTSIFS